ncbi:hypothetical protein DCCM_0458 [Desulfocucumis palustris]|uniref:Uncharacterized protein n=1 Tax=Desulfocucumis palustris TaxID=1898651 RepID=A0A2L2X7X7_9FIRM|nr:hypothetical protein DCCM_0458 [Desulfocucumis palustris]
MWRYPKSFLDGSSIPKFTRSENFKIFKHFSILDYDTMETKKVVKYGY